MRRAARAWLGSSSFSVFATFALCSACGARSGLADLSWNSSSSAGGAGAAAGTAPSARSGAGGRAIGGGATRNDGGAAGTAGQGGAVSVTGPDPRLAPPVFCSIDEWCGSNTNFVAIWGSSASDIWIVADETGDTAGTQLASNSYDRPTLLHWDGIAWSTTQFEDGHELRSVWGSSRDDVWAVGDASDFFHFDGKTWSPITLPMTPAVADFTSIFGSSSSDVWAVGASGTALHFDGSTWSVVKLPTADLFRSVWSSADDVWVLGDATLNHFDRTTWSAVARSSDSVLSSVWGSTHREAWVAGKAGTLEHWNPASEQTTQVPGQATTANFRGLWGSSEHDGWAVGAKGSIAHWNGSSWSGSPHLTDSNLNAAWSYAGSTWFVGDNGAFLEFDGQEWRASPIASHQLNCLWSSSASDVWAAGREIVHWDGQLWKEVDRPGTDEALALWGASARDIWATGAHGLLLHWDGISWQSVESPTDEDISGVWGSASQDVWAVDTRGGLLHFDGRSWSVGSAPSVGPLKSVWGTSASDVIAVGNDNRLHFDGVNWSPFESPAVMPDYTIAFGNGQRVWLGGSVAWSAYKAGGARAKLQRWDGATLTDNLEPTIAPPNDSTNYSLVKAGWDGGERDVWLSLPWLMHWDGDQWLYSDVGGPPLINALWGTASDLWAVTSAGQILNKSR